TGTAKATPGTTTTSAEPRPTPHDPRSATLHNRHPPRPQHDRHHPRRSPTGGTPHRSTTGNTRRRSSSWHV
ncbi:hypothetical protein ACFVDH_39200, partial [Streptomyces sp. NPDC057674]